MSATITGTRLFTVANNGHTGGAAGGAESIAYDAARNLVVIMGANGVDALNATTGALAFSISKAQLAASAGIPVGSIGSGNSVAVSGNNLAMTFDNATPGTAGFAAVYTINTAGTAATFRANATVGVVPDMIVFTPDGSRALVAIEGEPTPGYTFDAPGGITTLDTATWTPSFFGFDAFDAQAAALRAAGVKLSTGIPGSPRYNSALPSVDLEPEYIAISPDATRAYVTLQENNAIGVFNLQTNAWTAVLPLGLKNHNTAGNGIDTSDRDGGPNIRQVPIFGMYQPDAIALFQQNGITYLVTANEGDAREYGGTGNVFNEAVRISDLVPASGSTPPAGMPGLSPSLLAAVQSRRGDADLGRLEVSRWAGDLDGDGLLDQLQVFGGRSFSIWRVGGTPTAPTLTRTFDSGQLIDQIIASQFPQLYDDTRSDNKGAEPEQITLGTIGGQLYAFVGLERANANMVFRIDSPSSATFVGNLSNFSGFNVATPTGDVGPEVTAFIPASGSTPARLAVANEVSGTTSVYTVAAPTPSNFTLQILHGSDFEAGLLATGRARQFAAIVDRLEDATSAGGVAINGSITVSGGDNFLPGPFGAAGTDPSLIPVLRAFYARQWGTTPDQLPNLFGTSPTFFSADIAIMNAIGIQASALGNHEFDLGTNALNAVVKFIANAAGSGTAAPQGLARITNPGANFPYLSANLDFSADANIRAIVTQALRESSTYATGPRQVADNQAITNSNADAQIAPWTTIVTGGQTIGVLGLTTQLLASISSPGLTRVLDPAGDGGVDNMQELAQILQPLVDQMTAQGINKIVLLSHLQQYANELALAPLLRGVDVIVSAGSHAVFADSQDTLRPGDRASEAYPVYRTGADGNPVAIVSTSSEYSYVGRLVVTFDANGVLIADPDGAGPLGIGGVNPAVSGAFATTDATVSSLWGTENPYAAGTRGFEVQQITNAVQTVINLKDASNFGQSKVFLEGRRGEVRTEETNLGNLTADANLFVARQVDAGVLVSHKNGGGIRAEIGAVVGQPIPRELPPLANPAAGKQSGTLSELDIENSLRFNNALSIVSVTAQNLERILEHAVAAWTPTATPGQFGQWGGLVFSFDPTQTAQVVNATTGVVSTVGNRIISAAIINEDGSVRDTLVTQGNLVGDPNRVIKMVTLNFLADGGDAYPFPAYTIPGSRIDLLNNPALAPGRATFAAPGSEQDALAEYGSTFYGNVQRPFGAPDTGPNGDLRVMNLSARNDAVFQVSVNGTAGNDRLVLTSASEIVNAGDGDDIIVASLGRDTVVGGRGFDSLLFQGVGRGDGGFTYRADGAITGFNWANSAGQQGWTSAREVETWRFADGLVDFFAGSGAHLLNALYRGVLSRDIEALAAGRALERLAGGTPLTTVIRDVLNSAEGTAVTGGLNNTAFVTKLYADILGRAPGASELNLYVSFLNTQGSAGRVAVVESFLRAPELLADTAGHAGRGVVVADTRAALIDFAYEEILGRNPDVLGYETYLAQLGNGSLTPQGMLRSIAASAEFATIYGGLTNQQFAEAMYNNVLNRGSDPAGLAQVTAALNAGANRGDIAFNFLTSAEAQPLFALSATNGVDFL
jgi:2',3'-cyclic-nucleotide 2'-phosphodiesterase (5'-nucleotidase family)